MASVIGLISGLVGAVIGFFGAFYLQQRRDARHARAEILSIVLEMSSLEDALAEAIERGHQLRDEIRRDAWDKYATTLVNWLPWHVVAALHAHHQQFSTIREIYRRLTTSLISGPPLNEMHATLWCFVYWSRLLRGEIQAAVARFDHSIMARMPSDASPSRREEEKLGRLLGRLNEEALSFVRSKGVEPKTYVPIGVTTIH